MKNRLYIILTALIFAGFTVSAAAQEKEVLNMSSLPPGTSAYTVNSTFASIVNESFDDIRIQISTEGAGVQHAIQGAAGDVDLFMGVADVYRFMSQGALMYANNPDAPALSRNLRRLASFPVGPYHMVVDAESDIQNMSDFRWQRVFLGPPAGGATNFNIGLVESVTGLRANEDYELVELGWAEAQRAFQAGQIDVFTVPTLVPSPGVSQIAWNKPIRFIGVAEEERAVAGQEAFISRGVRRWQALPAGIYGDNHTNETDVYSIEPMASISTSVAMPTETAYRLTKAWWEGVEARRATTPWLTAIQLEDVFLGIEAPLHAGAIQYYQEIGLSIPERLIPAECTSGGGTVTCSN